MKNNEQVIKELKVEKDQVMQQFNQLLKFFGTDDFKKLSGTQQHYLRIQMSIMRTYSDVLDARITDLSGGDSKEDEK
ncbi:crAss001_48 related protein [Lentilactobacillus hilgardii]|uniref:crAss001_48 related protein n=1 Tax=Lentilactobacillus hilgardii TaxID=1588 RepID=UPI0021A36DCB|nr:hypothetical protein [Lentilactobacillus hilgardii]MCT3390362.1 hypothetical protein [Lentilactobacillus hilgardii]